MEPKEEKWRTKLGEIIAVHRKLPLDGPKMSQWAKKRKSVPKSELWTRSEREELAQMAEEFLKRRPKNETQGQAAQTIRGPVACATTSCAAQTSSSGCAHGSIGNANAWCGDRSARRKTTTMTNPNSSLSTECLREYSFGLVPMERWCPSSDVARNTRLRVGGLTLPAICARAKPQLWKQECRSPSPHSGSTLCNVGATAMCDFARGPRSNLCTGRHLSMVPRPSLATMG
jgi:hypothetical protein